MGSLHLLKRVVLLSKLAPHVRTVTHIYLQLILRIHPSVCVCVSSDFKEVPLCMCPHTRFDCVFRAIFKICLQSTTDTNFLPPAFFERNDYYVCWKKMFSDVWLLTLCHSVSVFLCHSVFLPVAIMLKDDYFVRGAGLPGRFKAEKVEFHWGPSNGSDGSEHSTGFSGRR